MCPPLPSRVGHAAAYGIWQYLIVFLMAQSAWAQPADWIYHGGSVVTLDEDQRVTEALAMGGGRILAVGHDHDVLALAGDKTTIVNLQGRSLLPGLIDSHTHPTSACMIEFDHPIPDLESIQDVLDYIAARTLIVPKGDWIVLQQVFITRLKERRYPTREEMDSVAPNHPVIFRTGPDASLNSLALKQAGIVAEQTIPEGSKIELDPITGNPTGILRGWSRLLSIPNTGRAARDEDRLRRLTHLFADYNSQGITGIIDRNASDEAVALYQQLRQANQLSVRVALSRSVSNQLDEGSLLERIGSIAHEPLHQEGDSLLKTIGIKMFLDGGMLTGSALLRRPWGVSAMYGIDDPSYRGIRFISDDTLRAAIGEAVRGGLQFTAHSVGDGAVHALIDAYEAVNRSQPIRATRPNITHCNFMSQEAIHRMASLGISADVQPAWLYLDSRTLSRQFSYHRMKYFQPLRSLFEAGVLAGGGSDHMQKIGSLRSINPYHPFLGMWVSIARQPLDYVGRMHAEQGLTRMQAIALYTINNARLMFLESETGSLEVGKRADVIELDRDLLTCPEQAIAETKVMRTHLDGRLVYASP